MHTQFSRIMQLNRSLEPIDDGGQATRIYDNGHAEPLETKTGVGGFSLDLLEPRPLAPPESRYIVTDCIDISMVQLGLQTSNKDKKPSFPSINVRSQHSRATRQGSLASTLRNHLNSLQSFDSRTNTIHHQAEVVIHAAGLPPPRDNICHNNRELKPEISSPSHVVDIQDRHLRMESMPSDEWSVGSQSSGHDHFLLKKSASFSSVSSSCCEPLSATPPRTVNYESQSDENWMEKYQD